MRRIVSVSMLCMREKHMGPVTIGRFVRNEHRDFDIYGKWGC